MIKKLSLYTFALLGLLILFSSCKKEYESIQTLDKRSVADYLAANNMTATEDPLGFYYQILTQGTGAAVKNSDSVYYTFDFKRPNGTSFAKSGDYQIPATRLGYTDKFSFLTIPGVRLTLGKLNKGGTARVILPSKLAFGKNGSTTFSVEPNEIVIIELALLNYSNQVDLDNYLIDKFKTANNLQPLVENRVRYIVSNPGTGADKIKPNSKVTVKYTGRLLNGTVFDSSTDGAALELDDVIEGWRVITSGGGAAKIGVGGKIRLLIPSDLAYGSGVQRDGAGNVTIPANSCLDFDIEIVSVNDK